MRHPPKPPMDCGVLVPRIVARDRLHLPCLPAHLCLTDLPCGAQPPYRLQSVRACGPAAVCAGGAPDAVRLRIPLAVHLCDACGRRYAASSAVEAEACAPRCMAHCGGHLLWAAPEVQLLECVCAEGCFHASLSICGDVYLLRMEACMPGRDRPACAPWEGLPMYPQPVR